jgi:hypothetical protein
MPESVTKRQITAIQLDGKSSKYSVRGISLGSPASLVYKVFGKPDHDEPTENQYGKASYIRYDDDNISFELNDGVVTSIKVFCRDMENYIEDYNEQLFSFTMLKEAISTLTTPELVYLLAPDFEISATKDDNIYFDKGFKNDQETNKALLDFLADEKYGLKSLLSPRVKVTYSVRYRLFENKFIAVLGVMEFKNSRGIQEIVFKNNLGRFMIWEIN